MEGYVRPLRIWGEGSEFPLRKYDSGVRIWVAGDSATADRPKLAIERDLPIPRAGAAWVTNQYAGTQ